MKYTLALISAVLFASEATASVVLGGLIQARQSSLIDPADIPAACQSACAPMVTAFAGCVTETCLCTDSTTQTVATCLDCSINVGGPPPVSLIDQAQLALDGFEDGCRAVGIIVTSLTVSGATAATSAAANANSIPAPSGTSQSILQSAVTQIPTGTTAPVTHVTISSTITSSIITRTAAGASDVIGSATPTASSAGRVWKLMTGTSRWAVVAAVGGVMLVIV